jgi:uncharacterized membrane protein
MLHPLGLRVVAIAAFSAVYVLGSYWLMTQAKGSAWSVVGVLAPMLALLALGSWRAGNRWLAVIASGSVVGLCLQALAGWQIPAPVLYLAQHAGVHFFLALGFGGTLKQGKTPLITVLATRVHGGHITPDMVVYTRKVTVAWTVFFLGMVLLSLALFVLAPFDWWALFANFLTPAGAAIMFVGEYLLRYRWHPEFKRTTVAEAIRSYMHTSEAPQDAVHNKPRA